MTNERLEMLTGELATRRQEQERGAKPKPLAKGERRELEQARGQEEIHRLSELAHELQMRLGAAHNRNAELESKRDSQAQPLCIDGALLDIGRRLGFPRLDFTAYGTKTPCIKAGELYWTNFSLRADCCEVKRALEVARKRDNQVKSG